MKNIKSYLPELNRFPSNGVYEITVDGNPIKVWFGLGVVKVFQKYMGKQQTGKKSDIDAQLSDMNNLSILLSVMSHYAGNFEPPEFFDLMSKSELDYTLEVLNGGGDEGAGNKKK